MDITHLSLDELSEFIESVCCFAVEDLTENRLRTLASELIEWHELTETEVRDGIDYYVNGEGLKPNLEYDYQFRGNHFENVLGY